MRVISYSKKGTSQMSSNVPRVSVQDVSFVQPAFRLVAKPHNVIGKPLTVKIGTTTSKLWKSEGHPINRKTGKYESGGPFHVTHTGVFINPGSVSNIVNTKKEKLYSGPVFGDFYSSSPIGSNYKATVQDQDENLLNENGATAISLCAPTNPTANLSTTLAESFREGIPSLPGIQSWRKRTEILRNAGSEYLNAQFGWLPLSHEVNETVKAARFHRDIMQNYRHNEGANVHRRFDFPSENQRWEEEISSQNPISGILSSDYIDAGQTSAKRVVSVEKQRKRWFEGCFTYGGPSKTDSFGRAIGFGSEADAVYGLNLSPDVLWELTPWSWAVDWFTNAGDVIHNISNFAVAGLVMRYGFMMEETIETYSTEWSDGAFKGLNPDNTFSHLREGSGSRGFVTTTKSRAPANPFGFGVGWTDLSPTQLAITAAIGITRSL
jgi:hypothetical protein